MSTSNQFVTLRTALLLGLACVSLTACGSDKIDLTGSKNVNEAIEAATGPLQDLNLRRQEIPPLLVQAAVNPYKTDKGLKCADVKKEVTALNELLGPDIEPKDISEAQDNGGLVDNVTNVSVADDVKIPDSEQIMDGAGDMVKSRVMSTIRSQTDILPFRSIIRSITGASKHQKRLAAAYEAGKLRRAYLKGMAEIRFGEKCLAKPVVVEAKADIPATMPTATPGSVRHK